ncbi:MAG: YabP/YqfC family sporulation protein [Clostridia bacterium]|nr:YabP/YqfC family sporulation protein [Clostridia bacterium]MBR2449856.1 YabP/YqfC family sporulation protein [Clostridia bacterium]
MGFIDDITRCFSADELPKEPCFRAVLFGDGAGYFENVRSIRHYTPEEIALCLKRGGLLIRGENLYVKKYCAGDVVVCGRITSIERV